MKALTIIQPWSWAIAHAGKLVENRTWGPPREAIGQRIAIHAGKKWDGYAAAWLRKCNMICPFGKGLVFGAVESVATIERVITPADAPDLSDEVFTSMWFEGPWGWVLHDVVALPNPVPCRGAQGLWTLPADVEAEVRRQLS